MNDTKTVFWSTSFHSISWKLAAVLVLPAVGLGLLWVTLTHAAPQLAATAPPPMMSEILPIITTTNNPREPVLAYNPRAGEYLVAYQESGAGVSTGEIMAARLGGQGTLIGAPIVVTDSVRTDHVAVAYHSVADEYLVVWQQWSDASDWSIYCRRLSATGDLLGEGIPVSVRPGRQRAPAVAACSERYLIVWDEDLDAAPSWEFLVYGQLVSADGARIGEPARIAVAPYFQQIYPDIVHNSRRGEFFVAFRDARNHSLGSGSNTDIYGQGAHCAGGTVFEEDVPISTQVSEPSGGNQQEIPALAYDGVRDRYLVVWQDERNATEGPQDPDATDVYGQILTGEGISVGTSVSANFPIVTAEGDQQAPAVAYSEQAGEYLVVWQDHRAGNADIYARRVSGDGALLGDELIISGSSGDQGAPVVAYNSASGAYLIVWADRQGGDTNLYGRLYRPPGLTLTKTASPDHEVPYRGEVTYALVLSNGGHSDVTGAWLTDTLPEQTIFVRWIEQPGGAEVDPGPPDEVTWTGAVGAGETLTLSFVVRHVGSGGDIVTNTATFQTGSQTGSAQAVYTVEWLSIYLPVVMRN